MVPFPARPNAAPTENLTGLTGRFAYTALHKKVKHYFAVQKVL
jgi:hypothetical protein